MNVFRHGTPFEPSFEFGVTDDGMPESMRLKLEYITADDHHVGELVLHHAPPPFEAAGWTAVVTTDDNNLVAQFLHASTPFLRTSMSPDEADQFIQGALNAQHGDALIYRPGA